MYVSSRISTSERWLTELLEQRVGHAPVAGDERVGVRQDDALAVVEERRRRPRRDRGDQFVAEADRAARLAVLREHELAAAQPPGASLAELSQRGIELASDGCGRARTPAPNGASDRATARTPSTSRPATRWPCPVRRPGRGRARTTRRTSAASARRWSRDGAPVATEAWFDRTVRPCPATGRPASTTSPTPAGTSTPRTASTRT